MFLCSPLQILSNSAVFPVLSLNPQGSPCPSCWTTPPQYDAAPTVLYCREGTGQVMKAPYKHGAWNWGLKVQPVLDQSRNSSFSQSDSPADAFFFLQTLFPEETLSPVGWPSGTFSRLHTGSLERKLNWFWWNDFCILYSKILFHVVVVDWNSVSRVKASASSMWIRSR